MDLFTIILIILNFAYRGDEAWTSNGPLGGFLKCIEFNSHSNYLYVGTVGSGVYRKVRFSGQWQPANSGIEPLSIIALKSLNGDTILAGSEDYGLFFTFNGGNNWFANSNIPPVSVNAIFAYTSFPNFMLVGTERGIFRSSNRGINWQMVDTMSGVTCFTTLRDTHTFCGTKYRGIYYSSDQGRTWIRRANQPANFINDLAIISKQSIPYFYAATNIGLFFSTDLGNSWQPTILRNIGVARLDYTRDTIYVATSGAGIWRSTVDNPGGLSQLNNGLFYTVVTDMFTPSSSELYATTSGGFFFSTNQGNMWFEDASGLNAQYITDIEALSGGLILATSLGGGLFKSLNNGASWSRTDSVPQFPLFFSLAVNRNNPNNIIAGTMFDMVYITTDGGRNWRNIFVDTIVNCGAINSLAIDSVVPATVFAGTDSGFYRSINFGQTWSRSQSIPRLPVYDICIDLNNDQIVYAATTGRIYKSNDGGRNFILASTGLPLTIKTFEIEADRSYSSLLYTSFSTNNSGVYKTSNGGNLWLNTNIRDSIVTISTGAIPYQVLLGTLNRGVLLSVDSLHRFFSFNRNLTSQQIICSEIVTPNHSMYVGTPNGVFVYTDTSRPGLAIVFQPDSIFSPDGDTVDDFLNFTLSATDTSRIAQWWVRIRQDTLLVFSLSGLGEPTGNFFWDGFDLNGRKVPNRIFKINLIAQDNLGNIDSIERNIIVNARPMVSGNIFATALGNGDKIVRDKNGILHTVYVTYPNLGPVQSEIFYTYSTDNGATWAIPIDLSNTKNQVSQTPTIAVDINDTVHVAWIELHNLQTSICYQRGRFAQWLPAPEIVADSNAFRPVFTTDHFGFQHLVWEHHPFGSPGEIYYRMRANGIWDPAPTNISVNATDSRTPSIICDQSDSLWVFWADSVPGNGYEIYRKRKYISGGWSTSVQITSTSGKSLSPSAVADPSDNLYLVWLDSLNSATSILLYKKYDRLSGWDSLTIGISDSVHKTDFPSIAVDSSANLYVIWEEDTNRILLRSYDHQLGWVARTIFSDTARARYPHISRTGEVVWTERAIPPFNVRFKRVANISDITPPDFTISVRDTVSLGESLALYVVSDELLREIPRVQIFSSKNESILVTVREDTTTVLPFDYTGSILVSGLTIGSGKIKVTGTDQAGNTGIKEKGIVIKTRGTLLPPDSVFAFPNPTRKDYINFMFYINQNAEVKIEVFAISGRRIATLPETPRIYAGGTIHQERMELGRMGTDIYLFRIYARGVDSNEKASIIKKFGVIR